MEATSEQAQMRPLSPEEQAKFKRRLEVSRQEDERAKLEMIEAAHAAKHKDLMPEYLWPDVTMDAWFHRKCNVSTTIEKRGGFPRSVATFALTDPDWETKHAVAVWLRKELSKLRKAEAQRGNAPVRRSEAMSRLEIAEVAVELLESLDDSVGENLICLFQELLDVDRHRRSLAAAFCQIEKAAEFEAQIKLQGLPCGVRRFAASLSRLYRERVEQSKSIWGSFLRDEYFDQIKAEDPNATEAECFRRAFAMYVKSLPERRSGKSI